MSSPKLLHPAVARLVPPGEQVPKTEPRLNPAMRGPTVKIVPTAENSAYEAICASYPATMTMKEGWVRPSVPLARLNADGLSVPDGQDGAHLCNESGPVHGRKCVHCGHNKTSFTKMKKTKGGKVRTYQPPSRAVAISLTACRVRSSNRSGPATSAARSTVASQTGCPDR